LEEEGESAGQVVSKEEERERKRKKRTGFAKSARRESPPTLPSLSQGS